MSELADRLAPHYAKFDVGGRLLLTGHSHQAWPDVALAGQLEAFDDAALHVDGKWSRAFDKADRVRAGFREFLADPHAKLALGGNTHELVLRFLSALDLRGRPRLVSTDGEFHTLRRQLARLSEHGVELVTVVAEPADTLAARLSAAIDERTAAVLVSAVLFETARIVNGLDQLADACQPLGVELLIDAYHALGVIEFRADELDSAWIIGGGYKYLQLGEGNCFLRLPEQADRLRPVITGWYTEFAELGDEHSQTSVRYPKGAARFAGATYDPTSHYRAARVFDFFAEQGLTPKALRAVSLHQVGKLSERFDSIQADPRLISRERGTPQVEIAGFLALRTAYASQLQLRLADRGVSCDSRGQFLRLGPAPYLSDSQLDTAMGILEQELALLR
jgi:kynureninase